MHCSRLSTIDLPHDLTYRFRLPPTVFAGRDDFQLQKQLSLSEAYFLSVAREASDPRDKLYSILGLLSYDEREAFEPDYTLSTGEVFIKSANAFIERSGSLNMLSLAQPMRPAEPVPDEEGKWIFGSAERSELRLPTWTVD